MTHVHEPTVRTRSWPIDGMVSEGSTQGDESMLRGVRTMNTLTRSAHPTVRGANRHHWFAALVLALAFALPGVVSASEGGFRHNVLMRGQVLEKQDETLVVCVGQADGAQVGQVLEVIRHKRRARNPRGGPRYRREAVGQVRIVELFDSHYAEAEVISGTPKVNDTVELIRP